jgi:hypothetical protein
MSHLGPVRAGIARAIAPGLYSEHRSGYKGSISRRIQAVRANDYGVRRPLAARSAGCGTPRASSGDTRGVHWATPGHERENRACGPAPTADGQSRHAL